MLVMLARQFESVAHNAMTAASREDGFLNGHLRLRVRAHRHRSPSIRLRLFPRTMQKSMSPGCQCLIGLSIPCINLAGRRLTYCWNARRMGRKSPHRKDGPEPGDDRRLPERWHQTSSIVQRSGASFALSDKKFPTPVEMLPKKSASPRLAPPPQAPANLREQLRARFHHPQSPRCYKFHWDLPLG